jgi:SAM-dependent methyltransferase
MLRHDHQDPMMGDVLCPICQTASTLLDVVDFNKSCEEIKGDFLPLSGRPIYYVGCPQCGFVFAPEMHQWSPQEFAKHVYNDTYIDIDPDYLEVRPTVNAETLEKMFLGKASQFKHLDYGAGQGLLSLKLNRKGWCSTAYDPFDVASKKLDELGRYGLITAFEVFEHASDVQQLMAQIKALLITDGVVLFSTLLSDGQIKPNARLAWWYAAPRNGHISLFSRHSLSLLAQQHGFHFGSFSEGFHVLFTNPPAWAVHLLNAPATSS